MKYRLLKDLPTFRAGDVFTLTDRGDLYKDIGEMVPICAYTARTLEKFPNIIKEWFEEIPEEPKVELSGQHVPEGRRLAFVPSIQGYGASNTPLGARITYNKVLPYLANSYAKIGVSFKTEAECQEWIDKMKAYQILRQDAKGFEPDWEDDKQKKWVGYYDHCHNFLSTYYVEDDHNIGAIYFATKEDVEGSFKKHPKEWLTVLGWRSSMKYRVLKPFGSRNGLKIYQIGEIVNFPKGSNRVIRLLNAGCIEPLKYDNKLPAYIRSMLQSWVNCNENPIRFICIFHHTYYETGAVDGDGFYDYTFYGYVGSYCNNKTAISIDLRLKEPLAFEFNKDYSLEELGLKEKRND